MRKSSSNSSREVGCAREEESRHGWRKDTEDERGGREWVRMWNERENRLFSFIQHFLRLPSNGRKKMMALRRQKIDEERERERRRSKRCRNDDDEKARGDAILSSLLFPLSSSFDSSVILECSFFAVFCLLRLKSPSSDRRKKIDDEREGRVDWKRCWSIFWLLFKKKSVIPFSWDVFLDDRFSWGRSWWSPSS